MTDETPKTAQSLHKPPPYVSAAERERERIRLQFEQNDEDRTRGGKAVPRATQDWTPYYHGLLSNAARYAALEGGSAADQLAINQMLTRPDPLIPRDPGYVPSPEALKLIEAHDAAMAEASRTDAIARANPDDKEASLDAREAALEAREAEIKARELRAREEALAAREVALAHREDAIIRDEEGLRGFKPKTSEYKRDDSMMGESFAAPGKWRGGNWRSAYDVGEASFSTHARQALAWSISPPAVFQSYFSDLRVGVRFFRKSHVIGTTRRTCRADSETG